MLLAGRGPLPTFTEEWSWTRRRSRRIPHRFRARPRDRTTAHTPAAAATLPTGFTEAQVASGLASPTAMEFAPDGRLFVCEQGGRLRVIKNGALLPTPFLTVTVNASGRARPARRRLRSDLRGEPLRLRLLHGDHAGRPQPHQPLHRERRRRRRRQRDRDPRPRQPQQRHQPQRRRARLRARRQALRRVGENANGANAQSLANLLGKMLRINTDGTIPTDNPFFAPPTGKNRAIWALGLRNPFTFAFHPGTGDVHQRRRRRTPGRRSTTASPAPTTAGRTTEGATSDPRFSVAALRLRPSRRRLRHHRRRVLHAADAAVPGRLRRRLLLRRLLRRLDPPARSRTGNTVTTFATRHRLAGRPQGGRRRQPLLPRARDRRGDRRRDRVDYGGGAPTITTQPASQTVPGRARRSPSA